MGALKTMVKLMVLVVAGAALVGVVMLLRGSKGTDTVSFDEWPDVATNPDASPTQ